MTAGSVMKGAASSGQQVWIGRRPRSTSSPVRTTSCARPERTLFGIESAIDFSFARLFTFSTRPCGGCISSTSPMRAPTSSRLAASKARHIRRSVPNWLIRSGCSEPLTFSNRSAGPPDLTVRSLISVISRCGSTSAEMRLSSPSRSRRAIQARRSRGGATARQSISASAAATASSGGSSRTRSTAAANSGPSTSCARAEYRALHSGCIRWPSSSSASKAPQNWPATPGLPCAAAIAASRPKHSARLRRSPSSAAIAVLSRLSFAARASSPSSNAQ